MKKIFTLFFSTFCLSTVFAQTIVPTSPQEKLVLLEEYTGHSCPNCADGHKISDQIAKLYPKRVYAINIHQGNFAQYPPDYRTPYGDILEEFVNLEGYPIATVDRTIVPGFSKMGINRDKWQSAVETQLGKMACLNVAAKTTIDYQTRELRCDVEVYYTQNSAKDTNYLQVAILQDRVIGPQAGANQYVEMMVDGKYRHNHMLREFLTKSAWGDPISTTKKGNFFSKTYTLTLPADYKEIPLELGNLQVLVYVTESKSLVLNVAESFLQVEKAPMNSVLEEISITRYNDCEEKLGLQAKVRNTGEARINTITFEYSLNGGAKDTLLWNISSKYINKYETVLCDLPVVRTTLQKENEVELQIIKINGEPVSSEIPLDSIHRKESLVRNIFYVEKTENLRVEMNLDVYASEILWRMINTSGDTLKEVRYTNDLDNPITIKYDIPIQNTDCYIFEIFDKGGDGISEGSFKIFDDKNNLICEGDGDFGSKDYRVMSIISVGTEEIIENKNQITCFPNPSSDKIFVRGNLSKADQIKWTIYDLQGRAMKVSSPSYRSAGAYEYEISLQELPSGLYIISIQGSDFKHNQKINITK